MLFTGAFYGGDNSKIHSMQNKKGGEMGKEPRCEAQKQKRVFIDRPTELYISVFAKDYTHTHIYIYARPIYK